MCPRTHSGGAVIGIQLCWLYRLGSHPTASSLCPHPPRWALWNGPSQDGPLGLGLFQSWRTDFECESWKGPGSHIYQSRNLTALRSFREHRLRTFSFGEGSWATR